MADEQVLALESNFVLGDPALVCRWRLASAKLPLETRHLKALRERTVNGARVSTQLVAWAKQHIEWTLGDGAAANPDGVLMIVVDGAGQAAMSVGPYEPLASRGCHALARRATSSLREARTTGVAPEMLGVIRDGALYQGIEEGMRSSGVASLVRDLAKTLGIPLVRESGLPDVVRRSRAGIDEMLLTSDEHGVVVASDKGGPMARRLAESYLTLLAKV